MNRLSTLASRTLIPESKRRRHVTGGRSRHNRLAVEPLEDRRVLAIYTVDNTHDSGIGSLRWAIEQANASVGVADEIEFNIAYGAAGHKFYANDGVAGSVSTANVQEVGPTGATSDSAIPNIDPDWAQSWWSIQPHATLAPVWNRPWGLPDITDPVIIDATTQPGFAGTPVVELDGSEVGFVGSSSETPHGLVIMASNSTVRGFVINRFRGTQSRVLPEAVSGIVLAKIDEGGGSGNQIQGNFVGIDPSGTLELGNQGAGIWVGSNFNTIGGIDEGDRNVVSGNAGIGISVTTGNSPVPTGNVVQGNYVGTDRTATFAVGNATGIDINDSLDTLVGGTTPEARNVISGNTLGVRYTSSRPARLTGNFIGTNGAGTAQIQNPPPLAVGVGMTVGVVGGTQPGEGNLISGNFQGIYLYTGNAHTDARVEGNFIGTDSTGNNSIGNTYGIYVASAPGLTIGGTADGAGNVISGNQEGIFLGSEVTIQGNIIGLNAAGNTSLQNYNGIASFGHDNTIGGSAPGTGNLISGNYNTGIIFQGTSSGNTVQGNLFGTDISGSADIGNGWAMWFYGSPFNNTVGGTESGEANVIAFNDNGGIITANAPGSINNRFRGNSIHDNVGLGIDLGVQGVTLNDPDGGDSDTGANGLQNFPELSSASSGETTRIAGSLDSKPNTTFLIDFYANDALDPSLHGEGERYLGFVQVTTDSSGLVAFDETVAGATLAGEFVTATATGPEGTSEFSRGIVVIESNQAPVAAISGPDVGVRGQTQTFVVSAADDPEDEAAGFAYEIDWGDGSPVTTISPAPGNGSGVEVEHVYSVTGSYTVSVTATDQDGATSDPATTSITITAVALMDDPCHPGQTMLVVGGTLGNDDIQVQRTDSSSVDVILNGASIGSFAPTGRIVVFGQAGDDDIQLAGSIAQSAWLYGDAGDDRLKGGAGHDVLLGGEGSDLLIGQDGRDLLIGGTGEDRIVGNADEDILIAGTTDHDAHEAALCAIMAEWTSTGSYTVRTARIEGSSGGLNGAYYLTTEGANATVHDDNAHDILTGSAGQDWFFANLVLDDSDDATTKDKITDLHAQEFAEDLDFIFLEV